MEKFFRLKENGTDIRTELMAGLTTFMTMAYILVVNPGILSTTGMDYGAVFMATCIGSAIATIIMGLVSNYPVALAPGMGLNAYFAYTVVMGMGYSWQVALAAVFTEGIIFIVLSVTNVREAIFNAIPLSLKHSVSAGIGLYIAFIGLRNANIVVDSVTLVGLFPFKAAIADGTMKSAGISAVLAMLGIMITGILMIKKVKGNVLIGILATWALGIICELTGLYVPDNANYFSVLPDFANYHIPSLAPTFMKMDFSKALSIDFLLIIFSFLFVDLFDTLGVLIGVAGKAGLLDEEGKLPRIKGALLSDSIGTTVGACLGTSTISSYLESASGAAEGGRTGLTAIFTAVLFGISIFFAPLFQAIPSFATSPALVIVGFLMISTITKIDFEDIGEALPAYISFFSMSFMYSISEGISFGIISYSILDIAQWVLCKRERRGSILLYILAVLFIFKYILI